MFNKLIKFFKTKPPNDYPDKYMLMVRFGVDESGGIDIECKWDHRVTNVGEICAEFLCRLNNGEYERNILEVLSHQLLTYPDPSILPAFLSTWKKLKKANKKNRDIPLIKPSDVLPKL